jgi:hypothetical protein
LHYKDPVTNASIDVVSFTDNSIDVDTATGITATSVEGQPDEFHSDADSLPNVGPCTGMVLRSARGLDNRTQQDSPVQQTDSPIIEFVTTHFFCAMPFTITINLARPEDIADAFLKVQENWSNSKACSLVKRSAIPVGANVFSSHVI